MNDDEKKAIVTFRCYYFVYLFSCVYKNRTGVDDDDDDDSVVVVICSVDIFSSAYAKSQHVEANLSVMQCMHALLLFFANTLHARRQQRKGCCVTYSCDVIEL